MRFRLRTRPYTTPAPYAAAAPLHRLLRARAPHHRAAARHPTATHALTRTATRAFCLHLPSTYTVLHPPHPAHTTHTPAFCHHPVGATVPPLFPIPLPFFAHAPPTAPPLRSAAAALLHTLYNCCAPRLPVLCACCLRRWRQLTQPAMRACHFRVLFAGLLHLPPLRADYAAAACSSIAPCYSPGSGSVHFCFAGWHCLARSFAALSLHRTTTPPPPVGGLLLAGRWVLHTPPTHAHCLPHTTQPTRTSHFPAAPPSPHTPHCTPAYYSGYGLAHGAAAGFFGSYIFLALPLRHFHHA